MILGNLGHHNAMGSSHEAKGQFRDSNHVSISVSRFDNHGFMSGRPMAANEGHGTLHSHGYVYE